MQQYWIPAHVCVCSLPTSTILLDLARSRYFGVGTQETRALYTLASNWSVTHACARTASDCTAEIEPMAPEMAEDIAEALVASGLLSHDAPSDDAITRRTVDVDGMLASVGHEFSCATRLRGNHLANFMRACTWAGRAVRSKKLYWAAREISRDKRRATEHVDAERTVELVCIFRRLRSYTFGSRDRCLFHALSLMRFLACYEVFPTWVIGVSSEPWAAHSWVQQGSLILDGTPEQIREYMPILAV